MKKPAKPKDHDIWFVSRVRRDNALARLNNRQKRILEKVRRWEKFNGSIEQKNWGF